MATSDFLSNSNESMAKDYDLFVLFRFYRNAPVFGTANETNAFFDNLDTEEKQLINFN